MFNKKVDLITFPVALLLTAFLSGCESDATELTTTYRVTAAGRLDAVSEARRLVAKRDGVIDSVQVSEGDQIKAGQAIATVDCASALASLAIAEAEIAAESASLEYIRAPARDVDLLAAQALVEAQASKSATADVELARLRPLLDKKLVSEDEIDIASGDAQNQKAMLRYQSAILERTRQGSRVEEIKVAEEQLAVAKAKREGAAVDVQDCTVVSPIDGTVLRTYRKSGEYSGASQGVVLADVADLTKMMVRVELDETDAGRVSIGDLANVWINGDDKISKGKVVNIAGTTGRRTARTDDPADRFDREVVEARVLLDNTGLPPIVNLRVIVGIN